MSSPIKKTIEIKSRLSFHLPLKLNFMAQASISMKISPQVFHNTFRENVISDINLIVSPIFHCFPPTDKEIDLVSQMFHHFPPFSHHFPIISPSFPHHFHPSLPVSAISDPFAERPRRTLSPKRTFSQVLPEEEPELPDFESMLKPSRFAQQDTGPWLRGGRLRGGSGGSCWMARWFFAMLCLNPIFLCGDPTRIR